jgi:hypothetical protein
MPHNPPHRDQSSNNGKGDKGKKRGRGHGKNVDPSNSEEQRPILTIEGS